MADEKFQFYKEVYFFEHERKNSLLNAHSIPIGLFSVLLGVIAFYVNDLVKEQLPFDLLFVLFTLFFLASLGFIVWAFVTLIKSYTGNPYRYIANLTDIYKFEVANEAFRNDKTLSDKDFFDNLKERLSEAATINSERNDLRSSLLFRANKALIRASILISISAIPYFISKAANIEPASNDTVKIINFQPQYKPTCTMIPEEDNNDTASDQTSDASQPTQTTQPVFPTNRTIVEGSVPPSGRTNLNETVSDSPKPSADSSDKE